MKRHGLPLEGRVFCDFSEKKQKKGILSAFFINFADQKRLLSLNKPLQSWNKCICVLPT